jgi:hypothetical protein
MEKLIDRPPDDAIPIDVIKKGSEEIITVTPAGHTNQRMSEKPTNFKEAIQEKQQSRQLHDIELTVNENKLQKLLKQSFLNENSKLREALGPWTRQNTTRIHQSYCAEDKTVLYTLQDSAGTWRAHA